MELLLEAGVVLLVLLSSRTTDFELLLEAGVAGEEALLLLFALAVVLLVLFALAVVLFVLLLALAPELKVK